MKDLSTPRHIIAADSKARPRVESPSKLGRVNFGATDKSAIEQVKSLSKKLADAQMLADTRLQEIIILSKLVVELRERAQSSVQQPPSGKTQKVQKRRFWGIPSYLTGRTSSNLNKDIQILKKSSLFDQIWYLKKYPDVHKSGLDPVLHYLKFGAKEGRNPGPKFNTLEYLKKNPGLEQSGENPLLHYIKTNG